MNKSLIVGFIGQDRPGLVQKLTDIVGAYDGNWLESRMSRMGGLFAGTARIEVAEENAAGLTAALEASDSMQVQVHEPATAGESAEIALMSLNIIGPDRVGILREVTNALAASVVNLIEMNTSVAPAAMSGEPMFSADAVIEVPLAADKSQLVHRLDEIGADIGVDILLEELTDDR